MKITIHLNANASLTAYDNIRKIQLQSISPQYILATKAEADPK